MPDINLVDPSLNNYNEHTELSIQVSLDGFSFCINSGGDGMIRAFRHYKFSHAVLQEDILNQTDEILGKDELLRLHHSRVRICYLDRKSTIVPKQYTDTENFKKILEFNQPIDELDEIHYNSLPACDAVLIFAVPTYFAGLMADKFRQVTFFNQATPLLIHGLETYSEETEFVGLQLNKDFFDIMIIREGKLKLYNSFLYSSPTDLLYFILYACRQLEVQLKNTPVLLLGEHVKNNELLREIIPYLKKRISPAVQESLPLSPALARLDPVRFFTLLNLRRCE